MLMDIDDTNKEILRLLEHNGRMSFTEIGEELGLSRVAVKKRVTKLEEVGIIRGYKAVIYREENVKMLMEITLVDENYEDLLEYLNRTGYVTELYVMTGKNRIHATAVAPDVSELKYLARMVSKKFEDKIKTIGCHGVKEIIKDTYGGVDYDRTERERNKRDE
jgi:DNA-binding Lrp family transcriptional regulator